MNVYKEKIVEVLKKDGEYNGNPYHNFNLVTVCYDEKDFARSCDCKSYRFNQSELKNVTGFDSPEDLIGLYIKTPYFNKFGKLVGIDYDEIED